jgi:hypothetical protein
MGGGQAFVYNRKKSIGEQTMCGVDGIDLGNPR